MSTIGNRIKQIRSIIKLNQGDFALEIGVSKQTIMRYETDQRIPDGLFMQKLTDKYNVNLNWLLTGKGEMYNKPIEDSDADIEILKLKKENSNLKFDKEIADKRAEKIEKENKELKKKLGGNTGSAGHFGLLSSH